MSEAFGGISNPLSISGAGGSSMIIMRHAKGTTSAKLTSDLFTTEYVTIATWPGFSAKCVAVMVYVSIGGYSSSTIIGCIYSSAGTGKELDAAIDMNSAIRINGLSSGIQVQLKYSRRPDSATEGKSYSFPYDFIYFAV